MNKNKYLKYKQKYLSQCGGMDHVRLNHWEEFNELNGHIECTVEYGDYTYIGGMFEKECENGLSHNIVKYHKPTQRWERFIGGGFNNQVRTLLVHQINGYPYLIVGGFFDNIEVTDEQPELEFKYVAKINLRAQELWETLNTNDFIDSAVTDMVVYMNHLYIGGKLCNSNHECGMLWKYNFNENNWLVVIPCNEDDNNEIYCLCLVGRNLYFGGNFNCVVDGQDLSGIARLQINPDDETVFTMNFNQYTEDNDTEGSDDDDDDNNDDNLENNNDEDSDSESYIYDDSEKPIYDEEDEEYEDDNIENNNEDNDEDSGSEGNNYEEDNEELTYYEEDEEYDDGDDYNDIFVVEDIAYSNFHNCLFIGGSFTSLLNDNVCHNFAIYELEGDEGQWVQVPNQGLNDYVFCVTVVDRTRVLVSGVFNRTFDGEINLNYIAIFQNIFGWTWTPTVGNGLACQEMFINAIEIKAHLLKESDMYYYYLVTNYHCMHTAHRQFLGRHPPALLLLTKPYENKRKIKKREVSNVPKTQQSITTKKKIPIINKFIFPPLLKPNQKN